MTSARETGSPDQSTQLPPRNSFQLLFDPLFGTIFWGKLAVGVGVWVHNMVAAILVFQITGSALWVGIVSAVQFTPQVLLAPLSGKCADRGHLVSAMVLGRIVCAIGSGGLAGWVLLTGDGLGPGPIVAASLITGIGFTLSGPALQAIVPMIIRTGELPRAMRLNTAPLTVSRAAGPAAGALLMLVADPALIFALAAATHLIFVAPTSWLRKRFQASTEQHIDRDQQSFSVWSSVRHVVADRPLLLLLIGVTAIGIGTEPTTTLGPPLAEALGQGEQYAGLITSAFGSGAFAGLFAGALIERFAPRWSGGTTGLWLLTTGLIAVAVVHNPVAALIGFGVVGIGMTVALTGLTTAIQERVPAAYRGRVMALWLVCFTGSRPLAAVLDGLLADLAGPAAAVLATAAVVGVVAVVNRRGRVHRPAAGLRADPIRSEIL
ncbi:MFS transporter [Streptomyces gardneri]|nr:MFS transporter [Streptomyces gardneri]